MKIAICDDEKQFIEDIRKHLDFYSNDNNIDFDIYTFLSGADLLKSNTKFDIAILDVEMDGIDGLKLGEELIKINPHIVLMYVTAHKKYLDEALNLNAVRFFEKPLDSQRFYKGLSDAIKRIDSSTINFYLKDGKTLERINAQDIIFIEIEKRKTKVITQTKEYHSDHHISFWNDKLTSTIFISPHKSYIINFNYVTAYERNYIILNEKYEIPIARNKQSSFYQKFMRFVEGK
jgi:DNA-binding LytR/AlgR family response regulator